MFDVICYGGPLHGQRMCVKDRRFQTFDNRFARPVNFADYDLRPMDESFRIVSYTVERYQAQRCHGRRVARRELYVALLDGGQILPHEKRELDDAIRKVPWQWETSILDDFDDFDDWWRHALYKRRIGKDCELIDAYGPWYDK